MDIVDGGKKYTIDDETGLVTEASVEVEATEEESAIADEYRLGDRVEIAGDTGTIIAITSSIYGPAFGVKFDDGAIDEFAEVQLKRTSVEQPVYDTPLHEVFARYDSYQDLPAITDKELQAKEREARYLNLRSKSLIVNSSLDIEDQTTLDEIRFVTGTDITDIQELRYLLEANNEEQSRFNRYTVAEDISGYGAGLGMTGDASWLEEGINGMEVVETTDNDLAARATEVVASFSKEQLEDDDFMQLAASFQDQYLQNDTDRATRFAKYLDLARKDRLVDLGHTTKEAAVEPEYSTDHDKNFLWG